MSYVGIDIGTTSISLAKINDNSKLIKEITVINDAGLVSAAPHILQSPSRIAELVLKGLEEMFEDNTDKPEGIGICCQMHGILYTLNGKAVSPLYTWRDGCGNEVYRGGMTYAEYISFRTGYKVFSGYGICTHFYLTDRHLLPERFDKIYTIGDYIAMIISGKTECPLHSTTAASIGLYDIAREDFDPEAIDMLDIERAVLPVVTSEVSVIGRYKKGVYVSCAVGDCQSAFHGSGASDSEMVLNMGTGGQISCIMRNAVEVDENAEIRPYFDSQYLYTASSLCGGGAYAALNEFFRKTLAVFGVEKSAEEIYDTMEAFEKKGDPRPRVSTSFEGTRKEPLKRGVISNLFTDSFTPERLTYAFLEGIADELHPYYEQFLKVGGFDGIVLTGNLARKCPAFMDVVREKYSLPIRLTSVDAEAAVGAAKTVKKACIRKSELRITDASYLY